MFVKVLKIYEQFFELMQKWFEPFYALIIRIYILNEFFWSGWLKVKDIYNGQWDRVVFLFEEEYKVPILSPSIAAAFGTFNEIVFPILLLIGLFGRFAALALFATALLIELTYQHHIDHILWMTMTLYIVFRGCGWLSVDFLIHKKFGKKA
jgi:putative oxidoreductase